MKYYQIKSTEKGSQPARWFRLLVPSGMTFAQLYLLLSYAHEEYYCLSEIYYYETKEREFLIEEFENGQPAFGQRFYDSYDAAGTYIDTFFKKDFRISLYTGIDLDLTIQVEKDAEEHPELRAPKVVKWSRAIASEEGGQPADDSIPERLFKITSGKRNRFRTIDQLEDLLYSGKGMYVVADPVTPDKSICKGKIHKRKGFTENLLEPVLANEELRDLYFEFLATPESDHVSRSLLIDKINQIMVPELGKTLTQFITELVFGEEMEDPTKFIYSPETSSRKAFNAVDAYKAFSKEDLALFAEDLGLSGFHKLRKNDLVKLVANEMLKPDVFTEVITRLEDDEITLLQAIAKEPNGREPENTDDNITVQELEELLLAFTLRNGKHFMPDDLRGLFLDMWNDNLELLRQKRTWMYKCLKIASAFYGVMRWDVLSSVFARKFKRIELNEIKEIFRTTPELYNEFVEVNDPHLGERLTLADYVEDDYYVYLENVIQHDKPFYIPSRKEIEEFYDKDCLLSKPSHQAMYRFITRNFDCTLEQAEIKVAELYEAINREARLNEVLEVFQNDFQQGNDVFAFKSENEAKQFVELFMNMNNSSNIMANRGYPPQDIYHASGRERNLFSKGKGPIITPRGPEAAKMLANSAKELAEIGAEVDKEAIEAMLAGSDNNSAGLSELSGGKRRKIGRNEPCPCGSGKKYKNCCGKS